MVRPRKLKCINFVPEVTYFKPQGVPLRELEEITLTLDELESLRLSDLDNLSQLEGAEKMQVHQSTFQRTLIRARKKLTEALINGKAIKIYGGQYKMPKGDKTGPEGNGPKTGRKQGLCSGNDKPGFESTEVPRQGMGRGLKDGNGQGPKNGNGRGRGQGRRSRTE